MHFNPSACKRTAFFLFVLLAVIMAVATFVGNSKGIDYATSHIYYSWWFSLLWATMAVFGLLWLWGIKPLRNASQRRKHLHLWLIHGSLIVILLGAAISGLSSWSGQVHLRMGQTVNTYQSDDEGSSMRPLPFSMQLSGFEVSTHNGTQMASDYTSRVTVAGNTYIVSMNRVPTIQGVRLYQASYDSDGKGSVLLVRCDRWGQPITYAGYALLLVSMLVMLFSPQSGMRQAMQKLRRLSAVLFLGLAFTPLFAQNAENPRTLPRPIAEEFGKLYVAYGGRICPVQTLAQDFCRKLCGHASWHGYSAEQVMAGWIFWPDDWNTAPIIEVKSRALRQRFDLERHAAFNDFFLDGYRLGPLLSGNDALARAAQETDDRIMLIYSLRRGELFKLFPIKDGHNTIWIAPIDPNGPLKQLAATDRAYVQNIFPRLFQDALAQNYTDVQKGLRTIAAYQQANGGKTLPSESVTEAERLYNAFDLPTWLYRASLTVGLILLLVSLREKGVPRWLRLTAVGLGIAGFFSLTIYIGLRTYVSGRLPLGNGFETMLAIAWLVGVVGMVLWRKGRQLPMIYSMPFLAAGFFLLVASLSQASAQISQLMPVLNSPLLSAHVSIIMLAYALLSFTFLISLSALVRPQTAERARWQSLVILYPAVALLAVGIFLGAVWANVSWGRYWGWDPKEVWALITLMVYVLPLHTQSLPKLARPRTYHIYMALAFATVLMTYFGVNYYLTGLHSYA